MANYVKQTWIDNNVANPVSAARMAVIENGVFDAHFQPAARVFHSAGTTLTTAVLTALAFDSERFDTDTIHDTVTNNSRLTCKTAGKYLIVGNVEFALNATGRRSLQIRLNGTTGIGQQNTPGTADGLQLVNVTTIYDMAVNDYVELMAFQNSGGNLNINVDGNVSPEFMMVRVA